MKTYQMYIGGEWLAAASGATFDDFNPYTGELYASVAKGDVKDADRAMAAAYAARKPWSGKPAAERSQVLLKVAAELEAARQEIAEVLIAEGGGTFGKAMFEISQTVDLLQTAAGDCRRILGETFHTDPTKLSMTLRKPRGTILAISPWNFPLVLSMYKVAYGLATGNTVVLKPASDTPVLGLKIGELFDRAGLVPGAFNVITGPGRVLGNALIDDDRCSFVAITGETGTGRQVAQRAAAKLKEYTLELGGKNPLVILADANIEHAVNAAAFGVFMHQGQICMSVGRVIVEKPIVEDFSRRLADKAASLPSGDPSIPATVIGPLINDEAVKKVDGLVKEAVSQGAKLLAGGTYDGRVYAATVLDDVSRSMQIYQEETFGPVASIIAVEDENEALEVANDTIYGLSAGLITQDVEKALFLADGLEAGMVHVNNASIDADASCPFGGCKWSGQGREGGSYSINELTEMKWITMQKRQKQYPF